MKQTGIIVSICLLCLACTAQTTPTPPVAPEKPTSDVQVDEYVVDVFEDSKGILWFGTIYKGVARYDGKTFTYLTTADGLAGNTVASIAEDKNGHIWLGTHSGLSRYDGKTITSYTTADGLCHERVSKVLVDRTGTVWVGTWDGVCRFNGLLFTRFPLPTPPVETPTYVATSNWVSDLMEDKNGRIWIARSGYGVCVYDGTQCTSFTQKDGLASSCVQAITQDTQGNIWLGSRVAERDHPDADKRTGAGGLTRYDGRKFTQFPEVKGLHHNDMYAVHADAAGNVWMGANGLGLYQYDGHSFTLYEGTNRMDLTAGMGLQSIWKDRKGTVWIGFSGGLFRLLDGKVVNVRVEE